MIFKKDAHLIQNHKLTLPLTRLKGVGPKRADHLARKGLHTIIDLLFFRPIRYEDRTRISPICKIEEGVPSLVKGRVLYGREERFFSSGKRLYKIMIQDERSNLELLWFQYRKPHLIRYAKPGTLLMAYGSIRINRGQRQMIHPDVTLSHGDGDGEPPGFYPVYSSIDGISGNFLRSLIRKVQDTYLEFIIDPLPRALTCRVGLPDLITSIRYIHTPPCEASIDELNQFDTPSHRRLTFDLFFFIMLAIALKKRSRERLSTPIYRTPLGLMKHFVRFFPFRLTSHQYRAIKEIINDFNSGKPMNRLLMGDVGCGKTVVAALSAYISIQNNKQVAMMVPTQVLANQHMNYLSGLSGEMGLRIGLLTGDLSKSERREIYIKIRDGTYNLIIGTHSLIHEDLSFAELGLVIIDEQHRFGVIQRALMGKKGLNPHLLVMTATPIPRTLAITVYGDMDISIIKEFPKGHMMVETHLIGEGKKRWVFDMLKQRMSAGQQSFVICPVIEWSEESDLKSAMEMEERLRKILSPQFRVSLIHSRLSLGDREKIMDDFRNGLIDLLVGTTVIEVGVHVPNATVMIIEHPERFGLAQLHQLRGRVGRGRERGVCILMLPNNLSEKAISRLQILAESHDGFEIARKDLELRGQGELTGLKQSGMGDLDFSEMLREPDLLLDAKREAQRLIESDPELSRSEHRHLRTMVESLVGGPMDL